MSQEFSSANGEGNADLSDDSSSSSTLPLVTSASDEQSDRRGRKRRASALDDDSGDGYVVTKEMLEDFVALVFSCTVCNTPTLNETKPVVLCCDYTKMSCAPSFGSTLKCQECFEKFSREMEDHVKCVWIGDLVAQLTAALSCTWGDYGPGEDAVDPLMAASVTLECPICTETVSKATCCPACSKPFCDSCLSKWLMGRRHPECPCCRGPVLRSDLVPCWWADDLGRMLNQLLGRPTRTVAPEDVDDVSPNDDSLDMIPAETLFNISYHSPTDDYIGSPTGPDDDMLWLDNWDDDDDDDVWRVADSSGISVTPIRVRALDEFEDNDNQQEVEGNDSGVDVTDGILNISSEPVMLDTVNSGALPNAAANSVGESSSSAADEHEDLNFWRAMFEGWLPCPPEVFTAPFSQWRYCPTCLFHHGPIDGGNAA